MDQSPGTAPIMKLGRRPARKAEWREQGSGTQNELAAGHYLHEILQFALANGRRQVPCIGGKSGSKSIVTQLEQRGI